MALRDLFPLAYLAVLAAVVGLAVRRPRWWPIGVLLLLGIGVAVGVLVPGAGLRRVR